MKKFTLYMGLNDKDSKTQKINFFDAYQIANNIILNYVEGATFSEANGIYKHKDGTVTIEKTLRIEILFAELETIKDIVKVLKETFNQESIAVQTQTIESELM